MAQLQHLLYMEGNKGIHCFVQILLNKDYWDYWETAPKSEPREEDL